MSNYTKVTIKKEVYEQAKIQAAAQNRSVMNYIESLILNDYSPQPPNKRKGITNERD